MAVIRKFMFENDFGDIDSAPPPRPTIVEPPVPKEPTFSAAELEAARQAGWSDGHDAGAAAARGETDRLLAQALAALTEQLGTIDGALAANGENAARLAIETGVMVARRIVPNIVRKHPEIEIESLFRSCLGDLADEPRIVLRVADPLLDVLQPNMQRLAGRAGFGGKVIVIGDELLDLGDCRIEWADGGVERDTARLWQAVDAAVQRHLAPPEPPAAETTTDPQGNGEDHGR